MRRKTVIFLVVIAIVSIIAITHKRLFGCNTCNKTCLGIQRYINKPAYNAQQQSWLWTRP